MNEELIRGYPSPTLSDNILKFLAVLAIIRVGLVRKIGGAKRAVEPIAVPVAGKHLARAFPPRAAGARLMYDQQAGS